MDKAESYVLDISPKVQREDGPIYKTSTTLRGLTANTQYTITVRPKNWVGLGGAVTLTQYTKLPSPDNVKPIGATILWLVLSFERAVAVHPLSADNCTCFYLICVLLSI